ncbi:MAG: FeoA family protein [Pleurocapsa sp. MO_192.B19]|nr:FeoA family protein [Pleurocapsa sp. MO_192.B19]
MTHAIDIQLRQSLGLREFQEFVFIGNTSGELPAVLAKQLHLPPDSNFLNAASTGNSLLITRMHTAKSITRQLGNLQFKPGKIVKLISRTNNGSVVVSLDNKLIGMGAEIAQKIIVTLASQTR